MLSEYRLTAKAIGSLKFHGKIPWPTSKSGFQSVEYLMTFGDLDIPLGSGGVVLTASGALPIIMMSFEFPA